MKLFLKKAIKNLFIVLLVTAAVLCCFQNNYWSNRIPVIKSKLYPKDDYTAIVLGTSHSYHGINSNFFPEKTFNFAYSSQSLMEDFYILKTVTNDSKTITKIILPISYITNDHYLYNLSVDGEAIRIFEYEYAYGISYPKTWAYFKNHLNLFSVLSQNILKSGTNYTVDKRGNLDSPCDTNKRAVVESEFKRHEFNSDFQNINPYFDSIYNYCREREIKVVYLIMPFSKAYNEELSKSKFNDFLLGLTNRYHLNITDERDFFKYSDESLMFRDADHLTACGREVFSKYIAKNFDTLFSATNPTYPEKGP